MSFFSKIIQKFKKTNIVDFDTAILQYNDLTQSISIQGFKEKRKNLCYQFLINPTIKTQDKINFILTTRNVHDFNPNILLQVIPPSYFIGKRNQDVAKILALLFESQFYDIHFELQKRSSKIDISLIRNNFISLEDTPLLQEKYAYTLLDNFISKGDFYFSLSHSVKNYQQNEDSPYFLIDYFLKQKDYKSIVKLFSNIKQRQVSHLEETNNIYSLATHYIYKNKLVFDTNFINELKRQNATILLAKSKTGHSGSIFEALTECYFRCQESSKLTTNEIFYLNNINFQNNYLIQAKNLLKNIPGQQLQIHFTDILDFIFTNKYHFPEKKEVYPLFTERFFFTPNFKNMLYLFHTLKKHDLLELDIIKEIYNRPFGVSDIKDPSKKEFDNFYISNYGWRDKDFLNRRYFHDIAYNYFMDDPDIAFSLKIEKLVNFYLNDDTFSLLQTSPSYFMNIFLEMPLLLTVNNDFNDITNGILKVKKAFDNKNINPDLFYKELNKFLFYNQTLRQGCILIDYLSIKLECDEQNKNKRFTDFIKELKIDPGKQYFGEKSLISKIYDESQKEFIINYAIQFEQNIIEKTFNIDNTTLKNKHKQRL